MSANAVRPGENRVSIVIPCYNAGEHIEEAVQSALNQTYSNLEIVIIDDGSDDPATLRLLERATWPRTRIFRQENAGPAAARNRAVIEATGTYILPLDADDTIEPEYVARAVAVLDQRPEIGVVYCKAMKFGAEEGPWELPAFSTSELAIDNMIFVTALYRKADWQAVGGYSEKLLHGVEDYDFWVKMVHYGRGVVQLEDFLFNYRVQKKSRTTRFLEGEGKVVDTYAEIFRANRDFYAAHAESIFRHRFALYEQLASLRERQSEWEASRQQLADCQERYERLQSSAGEEISHWRRRYGRLDAILNRHSFLLGLARRVKVLLGC